MIAPFSHRSPASHKRGSDGGLWSPTGVTSWADRTSGTARKRNCAVPPPLRKPRSRLKRSRHRPAHA